MAARMPCLFRVHSGPFRGKVFPVETGRPLLVGRALEADFTIPDGALEPFHCRIEFQSGMNERMAKVVALAPQPEGSAGTLEVDGVPFDSALLKSGEKVKIGETALEFREGGPPDAPVGGEPAEPGRPCVACRRPVPAQGGGRVLLGGVYCWRCVDLRLTVRRDLGRYRIARKIGRDVAEIVYLAEDCRSEPPEKVALHVLKSERQKDPRVVRRFMTKAASGFGMEHPAFPITRDLAARPESMTYVEEHCDWPSLLERLLGGLTLAPYLAAKATHQLIDGLRFARRRGMIVGKIRAMRVFVSDSGAVRIREHWLAPELEERLAAEVGAPAAPPLPPEPSARDALDPRDDALLTQGADEEAISADMRRYLTPDAKDLAIYRDESLDVRPVGAVFVQLATGAVQGEPPVDELCERVRRAYAAGRRPQAAPEMPAALGRWLARSLEKSPAARYRTLAEQAKELKAATRLL